MPDTPKKTRQPFSATESAEKMVEELYRLAEIIQTPAGNSPGERLENKQRASQRMVDLMDRGGAAARSDPAGQADHEWVLDVLDDLARYAENRSLWDLNRLLVDARFVAAQMLAEDRAN